MSAVLRAACAAAFSSLAACAGEQSALDPRGPVAESIAALWWVLCAGALFILLIVMGVVFYAMFRDPDRRRPVSPTAVLIGAGLVFPTAVLTALLIYGTAVGRAIIRPAEQPLRIEVTGHRWWWEVRYPAAAGRPEVLTANELRLPIGVPIEFTIRSVDVIHSFWIPNLGGKVDMIPGQTNTLRLAATQAGRFRGQCSEFCGIGHSRMSFVAIAEPRSQFDAWLRARAEIASLDSNAGLGVFVDRGCAGCHAIAGTAASGSGAPVLTHFADRPTIGAGAADNSPESLRTWLVDHGRTLKPGSLGPARRELSSEDVEALAALLEQLR